MVEFFSGNSQKIVFSVNLSNFDDWFPVTWSTWKPKKFLPHIFSKVSHAECLLPNVFPNFLKLFLRISFIKLQNLNIFDLVIVSFNLPILFLHPNFQECKNGKRFVWTISVLMANYFPEKGITIDENKVLEFQGSGQLSKFNYQLLKYLLRYIFFCKSLIFTEIYE